MKPTRLQLSLSVVLRCTKSSDTLCYEVAQTWTQWCGANCPPPVGELPKNPSTKNPSLDVRVPGTQPHDAHRSPLSSSSSHSALPVVALG
jgi:hypothetical protein